MSPPLCAADLARFAAEDGTNVSAVLRDLAEGYVRDRRRGGLFALALAGCDNHGSPVAEKIRAANSPLVLEVHDSRAVPLGDGPEKVVVVLTDDATDAQALDLWCTVIVPAGGDQLPAGMILVQHKGEPVAGVATNGRLVLPFVATSSSGELAGWENPACPPAAS